MRLSCPTIRGNGGGTVIVLDVLDVSANFRRYNINQWRPRGGGINDDMDDVLRTYNAVGRESAHDRVDSFIHSSSRSREAEAGGSVGLRSTWRSVQPD